MYFEINVALNGRHYFATAERSLRDEASARQVAEDLRRRFPEHEGFSITLTRYETVGYRMEL